MDTLRLEGEFAPTTSDDWLKSVEAVLKGADFNKVLVSRTYDDIAIQPLYARILESSPEGRKAGAVPWRVDQRIDHTDLTAANDQMIMDQLGGATGFVLVGNDAPAARGFGLSISNSSQIEILLKGLTTEEFNLRLDAGMDAPRIANLLLDLCQEKKSPASHLYLDIGYDPIGAFATKGHLSHPVEKMVVIGADMIHRLKELHVSSRMFLADGRPYHEAGASEAQELAAVLSTALGYLRLLGSCGVDIEAARSTLSFLLVADADEFMTIAKFRALRRLWRKIEESCGLAPKPIQLNAESAWRMMTRYDPWTNLLRCTAAVFSAGVGGADAIAVLPFSNAIGLPDATARRMARNIQLVLINEAQLWRVIDPANGAGGFENLTEALCEKAWALFQQIESENGIVDSLTAGLLQGRISETAAKRDKDIAVKKLKMTGISEFPDIHGESVSVLAPLPASPTAQEMQHNRLTSRRDAEGFEALRDRIEEMSKITGQRESVFIAAIGSQATYSGRATFARNFFEVAGFKTVMPDHPLTSQNLAELFARSGAKLACIASSDDGYLDSAGAISHAFSQTACRKLYLVCSKGLDPTWNVADAVSAITPRSDAIAVLQEAVDATLADSSTTA